MEVGRVTDDGMMRVLQHGEVVAEIPNAGADRRCAALQASAGTLGAAGARAKCRSTIELARRRPISRIDLKRLLASPNICSKRWIWQQYDSMVQTNTVEGPGAGDAGVIRIKGPAARAGDGARRQRALVLARSAAGRDACRRRSGAQRGLRGATPIGATNCLNFGNPEKPHIMWQFSQVIDGITKACEELEMPITGGNVSFYNETLGEGIYPTPVLGIVGILEDVHKAVRRISASRDRRSCCCAGLSRAMPPMQSRNSARRNTPRKFSARSGAIHPSWIWRKKRRCRRRWRKWPKSKF